MSSSWFNYNFNRNAPPSNEEVKFNLKAYNSVFLPDHKNLEDGDKIILHSSVLERLMTRYSESLPSPVIFEVRNTAMDKISHCGVLEFTAPEPAAFFPRWMMDNMLLNDGDTVILRLKELPRATRIKMQPYSHDFNKLANPRATLELALRRFTALTADDCITIRSGPSTYNLRVVSVEPSKSTPPAVCVIETNVAVEFDTPLGRMPTEDVINDLEPAQPVKDRVRPDGSVFYRFKPSGGGQAVQFTLKATQGDPDIYVHTQTKPSPADFMWSGTGAHAEVDTISIQPTDKNYTDSWYFICVHGYKEEAFFELTAAEVAPSDEKDSMSGVGQSVGRLQDSTHPDAKKCNNCRALVPPAAYQMHTLQCERMNYFCEDCNGVVKKAVRSQHAHCPECKAVMAPEQISKHVDLTHKQQKCKACGLSVMPDRMAAHRANDCRKRLVQCKYCKEQMESELLTEHQNHCGSQTTNCEICGKAVPVKRLINHKAAEHGLNPCLPPGASRISGAPLGYRPATDLIERPLPPQALDDGEDPDLQAALLLSQGIDVPLQPQRPQAPQPSGGSSVRAPPSSTQQTCSYCAAQLRDYDALLVHLQTCLNAP